MPHQYLDIIERAYSAFNARDIDAATQLMHPDVCWPNGWEGGYVNGQNEVRAYWTRQWKAINPTVKPLTVTIAGDGRVAVEVHQLVSDLSGNILFDGKVLHIYTFENGLIKHMEIVKA